MDCDEESAPRKTKRSFVEAWLNDERYKSWIRKVPSDNYHYYCTICNQNFSCNAAHVSRHADSACHRNNLKENMSLSNDDDAQNKTPSKAVFKNKWLDIDNFKIWLREVPRDESLCFCAICDKSFTARLAHIRRHADSKSHLNLCRRKGIEASELTDDFSQDNESRSFDERKKSAEIQYAALIAERNIPHQTAQEILSFFQHIGQDYNVLKNMSMGRTKCKNIISNVLCPVENENIVNKLQRTKFSVFIDETSDIRNKKWMIVFVRYADPETLDIRSHLIKLINIDAKDSSAETLFHAFKSEMRKLQIPLLNIVALSCDNASIMTGEESSFKTKLEEICKHLLTFPCVCHSVTLAAHVACTKMPSLCDDFLKKIAYYINSSPKRSAVFHEFCDCFQEKNRKIFKLSETTWLSHYTCIEKLLESWNTIKHFLQEMVASDKIKCGEQLFLSMMDNVEMKAYFLFLKYILYFFNVFNIFFQSTETRIHILQLKSANFLSEICENFIKKEYLKDVVTKMKFSQKEFQKNINEIFVGPDCEDYLNNLMMEGLVDTVVTVRQNCLQFYLTAAEEVYKRLPITNEFLTKLRVFDSSIALFDCSNRETSFQNVSFIAKSFDFDEDFDEQALRKEWFTLATDFTLKEKQNLSRLNFDDMWKEILQRQSSNNTYKYSNLTHVLNAVRALPNSNADSERMSILTDLKSKKRYKLSSTCVNATSVIKSALKTRGETAIRMTITQQHLSRMSSDKLYGCPKQKKK